MRDYKKYKRMWQGLKKAHPDWPTWKAKERAAQIINALEARAAQKERTTTDGV